MNDGYLDRLDAKLAVGVAHLGAGFADHRARYVQSRQTADGGFAGRLGGADIYYTDFALRTLVLLGSPGNAPARAAEYVARQTNTPRDVAECFNRLHCACLLSKCGYSVPLDVDAVRPTLRRPPRRAYDAFLAALCHEMLGSGPPDAAHAVAQVRADCRSGKLLAQTNSAGAAVGFLLIHDALDPEVAANATDFLVSAQASDGGFLAHRTAPTSDLLSTFTALVTLSDLRTLDALDLPAAGRFVRSLATADGGFQSCAADPETDVEYAYYGVASAALLRHHAAAS